MLLDCLLESLPIILAAIGFLLVGFVIAAVVIIAAGWTGGTASAFAAAVLALLAEWWISIAVSILGSLVLAVQLCMDEIAAGAAQPTAGVRPVIISAVTTGIALIALAITIRRQRKNL